MRIAILSRNPYLYSTSRLVLAARARHHEIDVLDPLELQIVVARGSQRLQRAGERLPRYHAVIPRIGVSITRYGLAVVRQFEQNGAVVINGSEAIGCARDRMRSLEVLLRGGVRVPRTVCMRNLEGVEAALELVGGCPTIVKLQHGAQGVGTMIAESPSSLYALLETMWAMGQEILLQEYIAEARGRDIRVLVIDGKVVAAMRRVAREGEFRSNIHRGAVGDCVKLSRRYANCATKAAKLAGLELVGVDILEGDEGPVVVEVNSSPGLEGIEVATGVDVATELITHCERRYKTQQRRKRPRTPTRTKMTHARSRR